MDLRRVKMEVVAELCRKYHGYRGAGRLAVYAFAVYEGEQPVAAYAWQPPPTVVQKQYAQKHLAACWRYRAWWLCPDTHVN